MASELCVMLLMVLWLQPSSAPAVSCMSATSMKDRRLSGPASLYQSTFGSSVQQRHSADLVRKSHTTHSLSSRFTDVLSLECTQRQLLHPMTADQRGLLCYARSSVSGQSGMVSGVDPTLPSTADSNGLLLSPPASQRQQLSFTSDDNELLALSTRTPGDFPSNLLLAPITTSVRQPPSHTAAHHRVSWTHEHFVICCLWLLFIIAYTLSFWPVSLQLAICDLLYVALIIAADNVPYIC